MLFLQFLLVFIGAFVLYCFIESVVKSIYSIFVSLKKLSKEIKKDKNDIIEFENTLKQHIRK